MSSIMGLTVRQELCQARNPMRWGNQIHSSTLWTLGIQKLCMKALGYNIQILH